MSDTAGLFTFSTAVTCQGNTGTGIVETFISTGTATGSNASDIFTWHNASGKNGPKVIALTYSGVAASALDQTAGSTNNTTTTQTSSSFTTTQAKEVIVDCGSGDSATSNWSAGTIGGTSATLRKIAGGASGNFSIGCEDLTVTTIQTGITATIVANAASGSADMMSIVVTLKAALGGPAASVIAGPSKMAGPAKTD
jgi:hypothetical protein